ncbi:MAG TPA: A/G-specific adenine glycosylase [Rhizomicrobium sp.]
MPDSPRTRQKNASAATRLLRWYDANRRTLPWRALSGEVPDPYRVWLSEIMLQQTTVAAVKSYYQSFLTRWPNVEALADASLEEVRAAWAGLGYYSRARNLHRAAQIVAGEHAGRFPSHADALRKLPGIGPYTAGAIAAIAFDRPEAAVDANAERVIARFFAIEELLPQAKPELRRRTQSLVPPTRAGDFAQALMDLGALICTPQRPDCANCPWADDCRGRAHGIAQTLPRKAAKPDRPLKRGAAFVARNGSGAVLVEKRPEKGLLGGMLQPPLGPWTANFPARSDALKQTPFKADWQRRAGIVRHTFTHFELEIEVWRAELVRPGKVQGMWLTSAELAAAALPTVMRKILTHAFDDLFPARVAKQIRDSV